jgi:hypothetical protein
MEKEEAVLATFSNIDFTLRALIDIISIFILVGLIYYPRHKNKDFLFTFVLFNIVNFMICCLLGAAKIKIGFAFGLFAMFSIIRYRTIAISIKDMGYFFVCVALGMLNSLASITEGYTLIVICNVIIIAITFFLEKLDFIKNENAKIIVYDRVDLIRPEDREVLIQDLKTRTGLPIHKVDVISIDYLKDTSLLKAYYYSIESENLLPTEIDND